MEERPFYFGERASIESAWPTNSASFPLSKGSNKTKGKKKKSAVFAPQVAPPVANDDGWEE